MEQRKTGIVPFSVLAIINYDQLIIEEGTSYIATCKRDLTVSLEKLRKQVSL